MAYFHKPTGRRYKSRAHFERESPAYPKEELKRVAERLRRRAGDFRRASATLQQKTSVRKFPMNPNPELLAEQAWAARVLVTAAEVIEQAIFKRL